MAGSDQLKPAFLTPILITVLLLTLFPRPGAVNVFAASAYVPSLAPADSTRLEVQAFLDNQPGPLKTYSDQGQSAATIIESSRLYYGLSPRLHLALLETVSHLLSAENPPERALRQPYGPSGPEGFTAQIEWASRELRAGLGPYERAPTLRFTDGTTITLTLDQAPEGVAVQRFLATGRTSAEWHALVARFGQVFQNYFHNELPELVPAPSAFTGPGFLHLPWPNGIRVVHLAYFDHVYPTVDSGKDGNTFVVNYLGQGNVQYNGHDGHDYYFPDQPIGTPILAAASGTAYARTHRGYGVVILHDNGYETVYWHLDSFANIFNDRVNSNRGVRVEAGDLIGTSGATGFVYGSPHLHFEVRHYGRQVDPYGWYGPGRDPCAAYAGCAASTWLWHSNLRGLYDFTPPDADPATLPLARPDATPPIGNLSINPPHDLRLMARFDGHVLQEVGNGFPVTDGPLTFESGRYGEGLTLASGSGLTYPISANLRLEEGSISIWARVPESYPPNSINRHYLFAASANAADEDGVYPGTLALRRDQLGPDGAAQWNFWTTPLSGEAERNDLTAPDMLAPGWHHFAITWDAARQHKALYLDGRRVAAANEVVLPVEVGAVLQIGRFTYGGSQSGMLFDELAIFGRALADDEIAALARAPEPIPASATVLHSPDVLMDTNALDAEGGIVAVQPGYDGVFEEPQPYYDAFRWRLPAIEGPHTLAVRYFDRAGNSTTVTQTVTLNLPPRGSATLVTSNDLKATLALSATDAHPPIAVQISTRADFDVAVWQPLHPQMEWNWQTSALSATRSDALYHLQRIIWPLAHYQQKEPVPLYVRFRDATGQISTVHLISTGVSPVYLPRVVGK